jgi:hypothetical protein
LSALRRHGRSVLRLVLAFVLMAQYATAATVAAAPTPRATTGLSLPAGDHCANSNPAQRTADGTTPHSVHDPACLLHCAMSAVVPMRFALTPQFAPPPAPDGAAPHPVPQPPQRVLYRPPIIPG